MSALSDQEIIDAMMSQASFTESLRAQIGEVRGTKVDRKGGFIHFFGQYKNCSFEYDRVIQDVPGIREKLEEFKGISFT